MYRRLSMCLERSIEMLRIISARQAVQQATGICLPCPLTAGGGAVTDVLVHIWPFHMSTGDQNLGPHACMACSLHIVI